MTDWSYEAWASGEPYEWTSTGRGNNEYDLLDFHVDLGCGRLKKGRIGIDHRPDPGVNIIMDLNTMKIGGLAFAPGLDALPGGGYPWGRLPFGDSSIESIISHHALEHIGDGFLRLMDECYRVLKPDGIFRIIVPLFPSWNAVSDPDHKRYFCADEKVSTFDSFCGTPGVTPQNCWLASFSDPYTKARFEKVDHFISPFTPVELMWRPEDAREHRVALKAKK